MKISIKKCHYQSTITATFALALGLALAGCASNDKEPNRQVAVYTGFNQVTYVPVSRYQCRSGEVTLVAETETTTPVGEAGTAGSASLVGSRCYYADSRGRPLNPSIGIRAGSGIGVGGDIGVGGSVGGSIGRRGGGVNVGVGTRR